MTPVTATACPTWCDPACCETDAIGIVRHRSSPLTWRPDPDSELTVRRVWVGLDPAGVEFELTVHDQAYGDTATITLGEPHVTMLCAAFAQLRDLAPEQ